MTRSTHIQRFRILIQANNRAVGGPDRPSSQRMIEQARADEQAQRMSNRQAQTAAVSSSAAATPGQASESYWAYMVCSGCVSSSRAKKRSLRCLRGTYLFHTESVMSDFGSYTAATGSGTDRKPRHHRRVYEPTRGQQLWICGGHE